MSENGDPVLLLVSRLRVLHLHLFSDVLCSSSSNFLHSSWGSSSLTPQHRHRTVALPRWCQGFGCSIFIYSLTFSVHLHPNFCMCSVLFNLLSRTLFVLILFSRWCQGFGRSIFTYFLTFSVHLHPLSCLCSVLHHLV